MGRKWEGKVLKIRKSKKGYLSVFLWKNNNVKGYRVHRLVAQAFIPNPENKPTVNHINEVKDDNRVENLEWMTQKEQNNYGTRLQRAAKSRGKEIDQYDLQWNLIATYESLHEAERQTGVPISNIHRVCTDKRRTAGGFRWRYANNRKE